MIAWECVCSVTITDIREESIYEGIFTFHGMVTFYLENAESRIALSFIVKV